jgi:hypothetical protein
MIAVAGIVIVVTVLTIRKQVEEQEKAKDTFLRL